MKTKITTLILLFVSMCHYASAYQIIISGAGRSNRYLEVIVEDYKISCKGKGNIYCPGTWADSDAYSKNTGIKLNDVTNFILNEVRSGHTSGQVNYKGLLGTTWKTLTDEEVVIEINDNDIGGLEQFK